MDYTGLTALGAPGLIDATLASGNGKSGYDFQGLRVASTSTAPAQFMFSALPLTTTGVTATGARRFGIATEGVIKTDTTLTAHYADVTAVSNGAALQ